jgi:hypothetical protein
MRARTAGLRRRAAEARQRAAEARQRAAETQRRAAEIQQWAAETQQRAAIAAVGAGPQAAQLTVLLSQLRQLAAVQQRTVARQLVSAELQERYADHLRASLRRCGDGDTEQRSVFMDAVAAAIGMPSAAVILLGRQHGEAVAATSDATARGAHDLEFVLGEGPVQLSISHGRRIEAAGADLRKNWPRYGPAVARLGVQAVVVAPLQAPAHMGAVCAYGSRPAISEKVATAVGRIADALPLTLACATGGSQPGDGVPELPLFGDAGFPAAIHQAAGMVAQQCGCGISDALALLRARAFASGRPAEQIAAAVLRGELRL